MDKLFRVGSRAMIQKNTGSVVLVFLTAIAGLAGSLGFYSYKLIGSSYQGQISKNRFSQYRSYVRTLREIVANSDVCTQIFEDQTFDPQESENVIDIGDKVNALLAPSSFMGTIKDIEKTEFTLVPWSKIEEEKEREKRVLAGETSPSVTPSSPPLGPAGYVRDRFMVDNQRYPLRLFTYKVGLKVHLSKEADENFNFNRTNIDIPLYINVDSSSNIIKSCYGDHMRASLNASTCELHGGSWDPKEDNEIKKCNPDKFCIMYNKIYLNQLFGGEIGCPDFTKKVSLSNYDYSLSVGDVGNIINEEIPKVEEREDDLDKNKEELDTSKEKMDAKRAKLEKEKKEADKAQKKAQKEADKAQKKADDAQASLNACNKRVCKSADNKNIPCDCSVEQADFNTEQAKADNEKKEADKAQKKADEKNQILVEANTIHEKHDKFYFEAKILYMAQKLELAELNITLAKANSSVVAIAPFNNQDQANADREAKELLDEMEKVFEATKKQVENFIPTIPATNVASKNILENILGLYEKPCSISDPKTFAENQTCKREETAIDKKIKGKMKVLEANYKSSKPPKGGSNPIQSDADIVKKRSLNVKTRVDRTKKSISNVRKQVNDVSSKIQSSIDGMKLMDMCLWCNEKRERTALIAVPRGSCRANRIEAGVNVDGSVLCRCPSGAIPVKYSACSSTEVYVACKEDLPPLKSTSCGCAPNETVETRWIPGSKGCYRRYCNCYIPGDGK